MVKKEASDNTLGTIGVTLGIVSIFFSLVQPLMGGVMGVIGLVFSLKQKKLSSNKWSRAGVILNIISIVLAIVVIIILFVFLSQFANNPDLLNQLQGV